MGDDVPAKVIQDIVDNIKRQREIVKRRYEEAANQKPRDTQTMAFYNGRVVGMDDAINNIIFRTESYCEVK